MQTVISGSDHSGYRQSEAGARVEDQALAIAAAGLAHLAVLVV
jgi:hypothetical protein